MKTYTKHFPLENSPENVSQMSRWLVSGMHYKDISGEVEKLCGHRPPTSTVRQAVMRMRLTHLYQHYGQPKAC